MKKALLIVLLLCFTSFCFADTSIIQKLKQSNKKENYIKFGFNIGMSAMGLYYATPYSVICGIYFLIKSSDDLAEIRGYKE